MAKFRLATGYVSDCCFDSGLFSRLSAGDIASFDDSGCTTDPVVEAVHYFEPIFDTRSPTTSESG